MTPITIFANIKSDIKDKRGRLFLLDRYSNTQMKQIFSEENKFQKWLDVELAVLKAYMKLKELSKEEYDLIIKKIGFDLKKIKEIEKETRHDMLAFIENINENLDAESKYIHKGITSNDVKDTGFALQMIEALDLIMIRTKRLNDLVKKKALKYKYTLMVGRTHGVHAEPITFGLKLAVWYRELKRHLERLQNVKQTISVGQISGAVGTFATIDPKIEELVMEELDLECALISNQILQRDRHADLVANLNLLSASIEKFSTEVRNLQRTDILEVEENFTKGQKGSSAMPHKKIQL